MNTSASFLNHSQLRNETRSVNSVLKQFTSYYTVVCGIVALFLNIIIVVAFIRTRTLRSSFMVYVMQLTFSEILLILTVLPGNFVRGYFSYWPLGDRVCFAFSYFSQVLASGVRYGHVLITFNRLWAIYFPVSYRTRHSAGVARLIIASMWCFVHAVQLPAVIPGLMYRKRGDPQCILNLSSMPVLASVFSRLGFDLPQLIIILCYPLVLYKLYSRRRGRSLKKSRVGTSLQLSVPAGPSNIQPSAPAPPGNEEADVPPNENRRCCTMSSSYRTLTALTVAVIVCWTPNNVYYLLVYSITGFWNAPYFSVQNALAYSITWLNPILFYLSLKKLQLAVNHLFCR